MLVPFQKAAPSTASEPATLGSSSPPRPRAVRLLAVGAGLIVAAGAAALAWTLTRPTANRYATVPADKGKVTARVTANGTLMARVTVQVGSQVSGRIQQILVDFNAPVRRGQLLARLDPELFRASVAQARANLTAAFGNLRKARAHARNASNVLKRARALGARGLIAGAEVDGAQADAEAGQGEIAAARGEVAQARAALRQAEVNLAYTTISSPVDGTVISRNVDVGQTVAASLQAPTLFTIAEDLKAMQVHTSVPEADVGKLRAGMKATFTVDAFPEEKWKGVVREIRNASQVSQNVVTYDTVVDVENPQTRLRPGMTANVSFVYAERSNAVTVANAALRYQPKDKVRDSDRDRSKGDDRGRARDGWRSVYLLADGAAVKRSVRLGISDGKVTEVVEGEVDPGDAVITDERSDEPKREGGRRLPSRL